MGSYTEPDGGAGPTRHEDHRPHLLMLCHRVPFPPNKGDKIRSYNLLRYLAGRYRVHLGAFVDDPQDLAPADQLKALCTSLNLLSLRPRIRRVRSLVALLTGDAMSLPYYWDERMKRWVDDTRDRFGIQRTVVFSSPMAQYVMDRGWRGVRKVMDFVDVDSDKWNQYSDAKPIYSAWIYRREAARLLDFEVRAAVNADVTIFVSRAEADLFRTLLAGSAAKIDSVPNGVDAEHFDPDLPQPCPYPNDGVRRLVFTGAMDYWANQDAVKWFAEAILPALRDAAPRCRFYIVGMNPTREVYHLAGHDVVVTGPVNDVRPYVLHADVVVAPMRIARGVQNKVLEGMAMGRPVVTTTKGAEGLHLTPGRDILIADDAQAMAHAIRRLLVGEFPELGTHARKSILTSYAWETGLESFAAHLENHSTVRAES